MWYFWFEHYLQVLHGDLHAGQVHVRDPGAAALRPVAHREGVRKRLPDRRPVGGDSGHGGPVTLVGHEAGDPGDLVVRRDPQLGAGGRTHGAPEEAEEEHTRSPHNSAHGRRQSGGQSVTRTGGRL